MFSFIANIFGYLLKWLYNIVGSNYGIAIVLFTIVLRIILLPITIKQQKSLKKTSEMQGKVKELQFKYKNNPEQMNKEIMNLYKQEHVSPFSGCLSAIIQILIILSVFWLVSKPLTYMNHVQGNYNKDKQNYIVDQDGKQVEDDEIIKLYNRYNKQTIDEKSKNYNEIRIIHLAEQEYKEINQKLQENEVENRDELEKEKSAIEGLKINMNFLGLDLSKVPNQNMNDFKVYIIPVLYVISSVLSIRLTTGKKKKDGEEADMTAQMNKGMSYMMPIMAVSIAFVAPLGLALYWFVSNVLMIIERLAINKFNDLNGNNSKPKLIEAKK